MPTPQPTPYPNNLYSLPGQQAGGTGSTQSYGYTPTPQRVAPPPKGKTSWLLVLIFFLVGLIGGGAAGYFLGDYLVFQPKLDEAQTSNAQLQSRVSALETEVAGLKQGTPATPTTGGTITPGTGTAPTVNGITPDPQTSNWVEYSDTEHHVSFKYPADYEVRGFQNSGDLAQLNDDNTYLGIGIFKKGEADPAGMVYLYTPEGQDGSRGAGPTHRELSLFIWPSHLPTSIAGVPAGAGVAPGVTEDTAIVNGVDGIELTAQEGSGTTPTPGGATYNGYLFEKKFGTTYLTSACSTDQSTQQNIVGCLFLTTLKIQ